MLSINQSTSLNNRATQRATKNFLMSYRHWQFQLNQAILLLQQPQLDNRQMIQKRYQRALEECHLREQSLQMLGKLGTQEAFAADLLTARFLKRWSIAKTCQFLTQKYHLTYLAERTFNRDQNRALRLFSQLCP
ncbi:hypothetical protein [Lentilactobacillus hilgardii]|uniref:hypothetical protein n=1 Tax=Lentilactobacillus hilgardii TaxID=1588 RepID=UPI0021C440B5|nr:hypothetical protein [Lentilactobacillus hilgardii]MCP9334341.1 hypothetical protein [Lentilactobacillus hilgardii]MCP9350921.1 hypothetical protein [Lentilactobacillus hilgardii]MCP9353804.1 hypothetical protein [Lentilactobacillus hilgardii]